MLTNTFVLAFVCTWVAVAGALSLGTCVVGNPYVAANSYTDDCAVLWDLYVSTNGPSWTQSSWTAAGNSSIQTACCTSGLSGVKCDTPTGRVIGLELTAFGLDGFIPESFGRLSALQVLDLTSNNLKGTIPASFGDLSQLRSFDLTQNKLSGLIPSSLGKLTQLELLSFVDNQLTGGIPDSLCQLVRLTTLAFSLNQFNGTIPECFGQLTNLVQLYMFSNQLSGPIPSSLGNLTQLQSLSLARNQLSGEIPESFANMASLQILFLYANQLTGSIPASLGRLSQLQELSLSGNRLSGSIPSSLGYLSQLILFFAFSNELSGPIPDSFGNLCNLMQLSLASNQLSGSIPSSLGNLSQLSVLLLDFNRLSGPIPESLGNLSQLSYFTMPMNQLNGSIPSSFGNLRSLEYFDASSNELTGEIPLSLAQLTLLRILQLSSNQLSGRIPEIFGNMTMLRTLKLSENQLSGEIPQSLAPLVRMVALDLRSNRLTGVIPAFICTWTRLTFLYLSSNAFSSFPDCALASVEQLELASNRLEAFPFELIANFSSLLSLDLSNNNFTGDFPLPLFLGGISLRSLSLANNQFRGPFPIYACNVLTENGIIEVQQSTGLNELDLSGNTITSIPGTRDYSICSICTESYYSLSSLHVSAALLPPLFPDSIYTFDDYGASLCLVPAAAFTNMLEYLPGLRYLYLSENNLSVNFDSIFDALPLLTVVDLRNNPHAQISSALSPNNQKIFSFDVSSAYPFSTSISCFVATVGADARLTVFTDPQFFAYSNCVCRPGYYGKPPDCHRCISPHAQCSFATDDDINSLDSARAWSLSGNVLAKEGYWASPSVSLEDMQSNRNYPAVVEQCAHAGTDLTPCKPTVDHPCARGYIGRRCTACMKGHFRIGERCSMCPTGAPRILFGLLLAVVYTAIIVWSFFVGSSAGGLVKVIVFFFQALFFIRVPMPSSLYSITLSTSSSAMAVIAGPECFFSQWDYMASYLLAVAAPPGAVVLVGMVFAVGYFAFGLRKRSWLDRCLRSTLFLTLLLYTAAIDALLTPLACQKDAGDGLDYMIALPSERCSSDFRLWSAILLVVYVVAVPTGLAYLLSRSGVMSSGGSTARGPQFVFSFVYATYRPGARAWELVVTIRRFLLVAAFACVPSGSELRTLCAGSVLSFSLCLQAVFSPYAGNLANQMEACSMALLLLNLSVAANAQALGVSDVDVAGMMTCALNGAFTFFVVYHLVKKPARAFLSWVTCNFPRKSDAADGLKASLLAEAHTDGL